MKRIMYVFMVGFLLTSCFPEPEANDDDELSEEEYQKLLEEYKKSNEDYLTKNAGAEGVIVLESGLQYRVIDSGDPGAESPKLSSTVVVHYEGELIDGYVFDSSIQRSETATLKVSEVIAGWTEILQLMVPGDKWFLFIPQELAYGKDGVFDERAGFFLIPPYSTLVFEIELISIQP